MNDLQVARDLRAAADYLRTHGWIQRSLSRGDGARCMLGALYPDQDHVAYWEQPVVDLARVLGFWGACSGAVEQDPGTLTGWNDAPGRTAEEVIDRLESTALALEVRALRDNAQELAAERLELVPERLIAVKEGAAC